MANTLKNIFGGNDRIEQGRPINAHHVSQSVDAFTGASEYDIEIKSNLAINSNDNITTFKFDGNNFQPNETPAFLVRNEDGTIGYRTGGSTGPAGPQGDPGPDGLDGEDGENGLNGTNGTSGVNGNDETGIIYGTMGTSGESGVKGIGKTFSLYRADDNEWDGLQFPLGYFHQSSGLISVPGYGQNGKHIYIPRENGKYYAANPLSGQWNPSLSSPYNETIENLELFDITPLITRLIDEVGVFATDTNNAYLEQGANLFLTIRGSEKRTSLGSTYAQGIQLIRILYLRDSSTPGELFQINGRENVTIHGIDLTDGLSSFQQVAWSGNGVTPPFIYSFQISSRAPVALSGESGTTPTPPPATEAPTPEAVLDEPQITIQKNLNGQYQCQVPPSSANLGLGDVSLGGSDDNDGSVNSDDVTFIYVRKQDKNGVDRSSAVNVRLKHFDDGVLRLKDSSASTTDFSYTNVTDQGNYLHFTGISANTSNKTFNDNSNLETFNTLNATWVYELKPNEYRRVYATDNNSFDNSKVCLVGLKNGVQGFNSVGEFLPGQRTTVEFRAGGRPLVIQYLTLTGTGVNNNSTDPYATSNPTRTTLFTLGANKRAIVDFIYYQSNDGSRYGLIPTGNVNNII